MYGGGFEGCVPVTTTAPPANPGGNHNMLAFCDAQRVLLNDGVDCTNANANTNANTNVGLRNFNMNNNLELLRATAVDEVVAVSQGNTATTATMATTATPTCQAGPSPWVPAHLLKAVRDIGAVPDEQLANAPLSELRVLGDRFGRKALMDARKRAKNRISARQFAEQKRIEADWLAATNRLLVRQNEALQTENNALRQENQFLRSHVTELTGRNDTLIGQVNSLQATLQTLTFGGSTANTNCTAFNELPDLGDDDNLAGGLPGELPDPPDGWAMMAV
eukprot:m.70946 g.70946  ORF g.70946 m.70946 type:complete len:278 (-) comp14119_c2_seq1:96-929(-)